MGQQVLEANSAICRLLLIGRLRRARKEVREKGNLSDGNALNPKKDLII